jgi:hypothetical protein
MNCSSFDSQVAKLSRRHSPRTLLQVVAAAATLAIVAACGGDVGAAKLKKLPEDASRDAVLQAVGNGPIIPQAENDRLRVVNGFRRQVFITNARQIEVIWYREEPGSLNDKITKDRETPILVENGKMLGWGWKYYQPFADSMKLPDPVRDSIRLDSIYKAQKVMPPSGQPSATP